MKTKTKTWVVAAVAVAGITVPGVLASCMKELVTYRRDDIRITVSRGESWLHDFPLFLGIGMKNPPQIAVWAEDRSGNYLSTLYATHKIATASWRAAGGNPRKEALPVWSHARGGQPTAEEPLVDGVSGATPRGSFDLRVGPVGGLRQFVVKIEVNHSTDWNDDWPENAGEGAANYSAESGQPALVYAAEIDLDSSETSTTARLIGHGSPDGTDGNITPDTSTLTTALDIVKEITIDIQ